MNSTLWLQWWRFVRAPAYLFVVSASVFAYTDADLVIAHRVFFDAAQGSWIGAHNWWVEHVVHTGGRWAIRGAVVSAIALWIASLRLPRLREVRRPAAFFAIASILSIGIVGLVKALTNLDCPWDLTAFGGSFPVVPLFADRPDALRPGHCFPAAHASSGYALMALYFATRDRGVLISRSGLALGIACGLIFGIAQQSRGAHFVSHDLWSAFLVWTITAAVYVFGFKARLYANVREQSMREICARTGEAGAY